MKSVMGLRQIGPGNIEGPSVSSTWFECYKSQKFSIHFEFGNSIQVESVVSNLDEWRFSFIIAAFGSLQLHNKLPPK